MRVREPKVTLLLKWCQPAIQIFGHILVANEDICMRFCMPVGIGQTRVLVPKAPLLGKCNAVTKAIYGRQMDLT